MKILSFKISNQLFGIDIKVVKEVNRNVCLTPVPTADVQIIGLYNLRGQVVTILDLITFLGYEQEALSGRNLENCIILKPKNGLLNMIGFLVDSAEEVLSISEDALTSVPPNVDKKIRGNLLGVVPLEQDLLLLLDKNKIFNFQFNTKWRDE